MPLQVEKLSVRVGNKWVLRDVSLDAADGEVLGIFGATGAGKSTLLRAISGSQKTSGGTVSAGEIGFQPAPAKAGLGRLFGSHPTLSDGEIRIAEFERSSRAKAGVLLFDEPCTGVDTASRGSMLATLRQLAADGRTIVLASSDYEQIASVCDRVAVLANGEIAQTGFPQEVYENPVSTAVASIVGRNNLFEARRLTSTNADMPEFYTIEGGHRVFAQQTESSRLGSINQNVTLAIRPEQISIAFGASFPEDNVLKAIVTHIQYLGETTLVGLDAGDLKLEARVFRVVGLNVGDECMIGIPPHRIQVLKR